MRPPQNGRPGKDKEPNRHGIDKRKYRTKRGAHFRNSHIAMENLEWIDDVLRCHGQVESATWKLVPKDSCEIYKNKRTKDATKLKKEKIIGKAAGRRPTPKHKMESEGSSDQSMSEDESIYSREKKPAKTPKKASKTSKKKNKKENKKKQNKRSSSEDSVSSYSSQSGFSGERSSDSE